MEKWNTNVGTRTAEKQCGIAEDIERDEEWKTETAKRSGVVEKRKGGNEIGKIGSIGYVRNLILDIMRNVNGNNGGNIAGGEKISKQQFSKISPQLLHTLIVFSRADVSHKLFSFWNKKRNYHSESKFIIFFILCFQSFSVVHYFWSARISNILRSIFY